MKKVFILASMITFLCGGMSYAETVAQPTKTPQVAQKQFNKEEMQKRKEAFEKRLNLTEEQKQQIKEQRQATHEKIKPLFTQLKQKHAELVRLEQENLIAEKKKEKEQAIRKEIMNLGKQIREIRHQNMKDFEAVLTEDQKKELLKIKNEGRKEFEKRHPKKSPFGQGPKLPPPELMIK